MRRMMAITLTACLAICGCDGSTNWEDGSSVTEGARENVDGRFISDYSFDDLRTVVDSKTGVTYLVFCRRGNSSIGGITPLLDRDGKPVISEEVSR